MNSYKTPMGELQIEVLGHSSVVFTINGKTIYLDPYSKVCSFAGKAPADLILITHNHFDHYDKQAYSKIATKDTLFVVSSDVPKENERYIVLNNEEACDYEGIHIKAIAAYNINNFRQNGEPYHIRGAGNGYILYFDGFTVYIAGDTELIPQMKSVTYPDIAFLPKLAPFTMSDEEFIEAANLLKPKYLYPYHYEDIDLLKLKKYLDLGITLVEK